MNVKDRCVSCYPRRTIPSKEKPCLAAGMIGKTGELIFIKRYTTDLGSSETIRETTFNFSEYTKNEMSRSNTASTNRGKSRGKIDTIFLE